ncbi:MAG: ribonuclease III [Gammaproteobacteria bacterium]|nr:ribonuclease III [Gammaproteobacteria bacterium]
MKTLQQHLHYSFKNEDLLTSALTHCSKQKVKNNERLEFLGDSALSLIISTELFSRYPKLREGELSRLRAALVKGETIAKIALQLGINDCLKLGAGELKSGGHQRESILSGAFEAVIGGIYLDSDFKTVQRCVLQWYGDLIEKIDKQTDVKDAKTTLQEWMQAQQLPLPIYICKTTGDAHQQTFTITCQVDGLPHKTRGVSTSRRKAEQIAAKLFLNIITES